MDDKKKDWLFRIFLTISLVWTAGVSWFLFKDQFLYNGYSPMPLNEIGDFLAGSFSPLAFFWLAYGYWMQNKELKNQLDEFRNSIEVQKDLAKAANNESQLNYANFRTTNLEKIKKFTPKISLKAWALDRKKSSSLILKISNDGMECYEVTVVIASKGDIIKMSKHDKMPENSSGNLNFDLDTIPKGDIDLVLMFSNDMQRNIEITYRLGRSNIDTETGEILEILTERSNYRL
ncbi:hypothetical protein [Marinomonas shanghaiensis]|uniref:hypothetical protein n=1 Tax=Marinomonas shanghaiensis TaxID=2202418 RepID=UPI000DBAC441|nr:hypothetical protein [Marinomonas shanghaiensis]